MKRFLFLVIAVIFWTVPAQAIEILKSSETATCADSGDGNPGAVTITIDEGNAIYAVALTVSDADGCNVTIAETNAVDGFVLVITNVSAANTATITTAANQYELEQGSPYVMGADDNVTFIYRSSKWLELGRTGALAGTFGGFSTTAGTAVVSNASGELSQTLDALLPDLAGGADLGSATVEWDDLFLHDGAVISGQEDQSATLTSSASLWTANNFAVDTQFKLPSSDAGPTATAGYLRHDNTISNHTRGGLVWHDGTNIRQVVDMVTATASACTAGQVVAYSADDDLWYCKDDADTGGATAYNSIGDPTGAGSISFDDGETMTYDGAWNDEVVLTLSINTADLSADTTALLITAVDNDDANYIPLLIQDDQDGTPDTLFKVDYTGAVTAAGLVTANAGVTVADSQVLTFDESAADPNDADVFLSATDGVLTIGTANGANNENLTLNLDGTSNSAVVGTTTDVDTITFTSMKITGASVDVTGDVVIGDDIIMQDDIQMDSDGAIIQFGEDQDVVVTHVADTGLLLGDGDGTATTQLQFGDSGTYINQSADGILAVVSDTEVKIVANDEDLKFTKTGANGITLGTNTGVTDITTAINLRSSAYINGLMPPVVLTIASGVQDGGDDQAVLTDSGESFTTSQFVGMTLYNITDGSSCTVTANNGTTITCTLAGGTGNDWDDGDVWQVGPGPNQSGTWFYVVAASTIRHPATVGYVVCYESDAAAAVVVDFASESMIFQGVLDTAVQVNSAGHYITSSGSTTGDYQCLHNKSATEAQGKGKRGTWTKEADD